MKLNPLYMPVRELSKHIHEGKISPVELAEFFLERLEKLGPDFNAVVTVTREKALSQARKARERDRRGPVQGTTSRNTIRRQRSARNRRHTYHLGRGAVQESNIRL